MITQYKVIVRKLFSDSEEKVTLLIHEHELTCFIAYCPFSLQVGQSFTAELDYEVFNDYKVSLNHKEESCFETTDNDYSYWIKGKVSNGTIDVGGIVFEDDNLLTEYPDFDGEYIKLRVDRLDVSFIELKGSEPFDSLL